MTNTKTLIPLDTWIPTTWPDFLDIIEDPTYEKRKAYYYHHSMRLEMLSVLKRTSLNFYLKFVENFPKPDKLSFKDYTRRNL